MSEPRMPTVERVDSAEGSSVDRTEEAIIDAVVADVLVEEVSIDGMCGVY